jgi:uncharacterized BrkB/YihY/UPF0761 family membrane protein
MIKLKHKKRIKSALLQVGIFLGIYGTSVLIMFISKVQQTAFSLSNVTAYVENLPNSAYFYISLLSLVIQGAGTLIYKKVTRRKK